MRDTGGELEVSLIGRSGELREKGTFYAEIVRVRRDADGKRYLIAFEEIDQGTRIMYDLDLDNYWIKSICFMPDVGWGDVLEAYSETPEDLSDAIETIESCLGRGEEEEEIVTGGPKRIEVVFQRNDAPGSARTRVVIHQVVPKNGNFDYLTASGRVWKNEGRDLSKDPEHFHSCLYWISEIHLFSGGTAGAIGVSKYQKFSAEMAWGFLDKSYNGFKSAERTVVRNWETKVVIPENVSSGHAGHPSWDPTGLGYPGAGEPHYYNRVPNHYKPNVGCWRTAGDETGIALHQQQEGVKCRDPQSLEELIDIEEALRAKAQTSEDEEGKKKKPAPAICPRTHSGTRNISAGSTDQVSGETAVTGGAGVVRQISEHASSVDVKYCDCGGPQCENCMWRKALDDYRARPQPGSEKEPLRIIH